MENLPQYPLFPQLEQARPGWRALAKAALRLAFLRRTPVEQLAASWGQILAAVLLSLLPPLAFAIATIGKQGYVAWMYLPGVLFHVPVMLLAAIVLAHLIDARNQVGTILMAALLAWIVIDVVSLGLTFALQGQLGLSRMANMAFYYAPLVWLTIAMARFAIGLSPPSARRTAFALAACAIFIGFPLASIDRERSLWSMDYSRTQSESPAIRSERMAAASEDGFYRQPELLQRALADLKPGRKGLVDVYFVGFAGYGNQDVFMREVDSVAALFRERFRADGHIVKLINNPKTVLSQPVASATSLKATLKRMAELMDPDEDVLVLFLTSHASQDHRFSIELWPLEFKQLTPEMLRDILDASGIKNRVVIVSACYAGGFVRSLSNDNTLVITAAAPDRNSFGCSNENDWTYFGKAYFDEALRNTVSFTDAFEMAKPVIEARERKENFDPSRPQMSVGIAIKDKLAALEQQLTSATPAMVPAEEKPLASPDKAEQYVALLFQPEMARTFREACKRDMELNGPEKSLERAPNSMGGLNHSSAQWPRLVAAWDRYVEEACAKANDPKLFRAAYLAEVRQSMNDKDLDIAIRMMSGGEGRQWYEKEKEISSQLMKRIAQAQRLATEPLYAGFIQDRDRLYAESFGRHK